MVDIRNVRGFITLVIIAIIAMMAVTTVLPQAQNAGDELTEAGQCTNVGCVYNTSQSSSQPCRFVANQTLTCPAGQPPGLPLANLLVGSGIVFIVVMVGVIIFLIRLRKFQ